MVVNTLEEFFNGYFFGARYMCIVVQYISPLSDTSIQYCVLLSHHQTVLATLKKPKI